ncbi:MAG: DUF5020 family protein [Bacteroidales bacterium]|nr:DUF5020 family protein [Bacteroidales bacterium]
MKKFLLFAIMTLGAFAARSQNIQLHYDFGRDIYSDEESERQKVTVTLEQFKADKWGSWYYFVDLDLSRKETMAAYAEISREVRFGNESPFAAHLEYDGGLGAHSGSYQQAMLFGGAYNGHNEDFSTTWSVQLLYKRFFDDANGNSGYNSVQLTGVWGITFANKKCTFSGFIDFWRGKQPNGHGQLVILAEPQFWYNITEHLSVGTEMEISNNFIFNLYNDKTFFINPTVGVKWNF